MHNTVCAMYLNDCSNDLNPKTFFFSVNGNGAIELLQQHSWKKNMISKVQMSTLILLLLISSFAPGNILAIFQKFMLRPFHYLEQAVTVECKHFHCLSPGHHLGIRSSASTLAVSQCKHYSHKTYAKYVIPDIWDTVLEYILQFFSLPTGRYATAL